MCECAGKCVTEREAVERERKAYFEGGVTFMGLHHSNDYVRSQSAARYPLPKVRRLREWMSPLGSRLYRFNPEIGDWETRRPGFTTTWQPWNGAAGSDMICPLADLKRDPYEEVDG